MKKFDKVMNKKTAALKRQILLIDNNKINIEYMKKMINIDQIINNIINLF